MRKSGGPLIILLVLVQLSVTGYLYVNRTTELALVTLEVSFAHYACGAYSDDMVIHRINEERFGTLVGRDIDPHLQGIRNFESHMAQAYEQDVFRRYQLEGHLAIGSSSGCSEEALNFYVKRIISAEPISP